MNLIYETLIIIGVALFLIAFASLICFRNRDAHYFIRSRGVELDHYILKKSKFLFIFAFGLTWNWKTGIIRKSILWISLCFYIYFLVFYIADVIYYIIVNSCMIISAPIIWVIFAVILPIVLSITTSVVITITNKPSKIYCEEM